MSIEEARERLERTEQNPYSDKARQDARLATAHALVAIHDLILGYMWGASGRVEANLIAPAYHFTMGCDVAAGAYIAVGPGGKLYPTKADHPAYLSPLGQLAMDADEGDDVWSTLESVSGTGPMFFKGEAL